MSLWLVALVCGVALWVAYVTYGRFVSRLLRLDPDAQTPAYSMRDDVDYVPTDNRFLIGQHFSAIAAAGPIVGPILAGMLFGWLPAVLWIVLGAIFVGGVHDLASLTASIRHKATSIAEIVRRHMSARSYAMFLAFIWLALIYIIVAFTDITAASFVGMLRLENGETVRGAGIATSSALYLALPIVMGLLMKFGRLSLGWATVIFLPLVVLTIVVGQWLPMDLAARLGASDLTAQRIWSAGILLYCLVAAVLPMWLLLQPRGHLGGYFLFFFLAVGGLGLLFGGRQIEYPAFLGFEPKEGSTLAPFLFITIACGACSGFHALIASGTTSKQLRRETDASPIGYGTMLMEAMVAVIALSTVMMLSRNAELLKSPPNMIFATGIGGYLQQVGIPAALATSIMLMAFTTFVYDTLDVCTRLGRYVIQELTGWRSRAGAWFATGITAGVPLAFMLLVPPNLGPDGKPIPSWQTFWQLFGASNQLLAALTLLGITVWLWRTRKALWVFAVTGLPCAFMYVMSVWALVVQIRNAYDKAGTIQPVFIVGLMLVVLAGLMLVEAFRAFLGRGAPGEPLPVAA